MDPGNNSTNSSSSFNNNDAPASTLPIDTHHQSTTTMTAQAQAQAEAQALLFSFVRHHQWKEFEDRVRSKVDTPHTLWTARVETEEDCQYFGIVRRRRGDDHDNDHDDDDDGHEDENLTLLNALLLCKQNNPGSHNSSISNATTRNSSTRNSRLDVPPLSAIQCLIERTDEYVKEERQKQKQLDPTAAAAAVSLVAMTTNEYQDTPLHQVCATMAERNDIVKYLIAQYPAAVCKKNNLYYRPIDIMSNRIIMLEEVMKYNSHNSNSSSASEITNNRTTSDSTNSPSSSSSNHHTTVSDLSSEMDRMWTTVYELGKAAVSVTANASPNANPNADGDHDDPGNEVSLKARTSIQQQQEGKELFTFVNCPEFPICLFQRALKRYPQQLLNDVDDCINKNRLLHVIIQNTPQHPRHSTRSNNHANNGPDSQDDDDSDEDDDDNDNNNRELFPYILKADPKAASVMNGHDQIPLKLAIDSGYPLSSSTIQSLIKTYPEGLNMLDLPSNVIPKVLERLVGESKTSSLSSSAASTTTRFRSTESQRRDMLLIVFKYLRSANASSSTISSRKKKAELKEEQEDPSK